MKRNSGSREEKHNKASLARLWITWLTAGFQLYNIPPNLLGAETHFRVSPVAGIRKQ